MSLLRHFSNSCLSFDDLGGLDEDNARDRIARQPMVLGPGTEMFLDGQPTQPVLSSATMAKAFSGSLLDLNAYNPDAEEDPPEGGSYQQPVTSTTIFQNLTAEVTRQKERQKRVADTVTVIGAHTFVGSHIVHYLLESGYIVRAIVRDKSAANMRALSSATPDAHHSLSLITFDETDPTHYESVIQGSTYVINALLPSLPNPLVIDQCVQFMFDAIRKVGKKTVRRVVLTGSATSVSHPTDPDVPNGYDETHDNTKTMKASEPLQYARINAEKEAIRLAHVVDIELVTILPTLAIGPARCNEISESVRTIQDIAIGSKWFPFAPKLYWNFVDVRDVARAHIAALENPRAKNQRYIVGSRATKYSEIGRIIKSRYPHLTPPIYDAPNLLTLIVGPIFNTRVSLGYLWRTLGKVRTFNCNKLRHDLGINLTPLERTIEDIVEDLIIAGVVAHSEAAARGDGTASGKSTALLQVVKWGKVVGAVVALGWAWRKIR
eukprot:PhF_6_TR10992/c1_g1_i1/m.17786